MNRKKLRLLIFPTIAIIIGIIISIANSNVTGLSGDEWVKKSHPYMEHANSFIENMDNILTLYFSGVTNTDSYSNDYELLKKQWKLLRADFDKFREDNPVLPDTDTVSSQLGYEAIADFYDEIDDLFKELDTVDKSNPRHISYVYLARQQDLLDYYTTYTITYNIITGVYSETAEPTT